MDQRTSNGPELVLSVRDRRYAIRYPCAADIELLDLETGSRSSGVTSDLSLGGCFVCTTKTMPLRTRVRASLVRKNRTVEALAVVRVVKLRVGVGLEFIDVDSASHEFLIRWIDELRRDR